MTCDYITDDFGLGQPTLRRIRADIESRAMAEHAATLLSTSYINSLVLASEARMFRQSRAAWELVQ